MSSILSDKDIGTRSEHLQWCKDRALQYLASGDTQGAFASFASDLNKHSQTRDHAALSLGMMLLVSGHLSTSQQMREFIEGTN